MSILLQFSIFPTDSGESLSRQVSEVVQYIKATGIPYRLNAMGTTIETETMHEALAIVEQAYEFMRQNSHRVYCQIAIDARQGAMGRLDKKIASIEQHIGPVSH